MTNFADRFRVRYSTLASVWKVLAEGEMPERFPVEWKNINYYAHVFSNQQPQNSTYKADLRDLQ